MKKYARVIVLLGISLLSLCFANDQQSTMKFYQFFNTDTELFETNPVPTEYNAYQAFKKKPLKCAVNYLVVPWRVLMKQKMLDKVLMIKLNGGFTVCQYKEYRPILPILKNIGIDVLFATHARKDAVYHNIKILPFPHCAVQGVPPASTKDILYSFIGYVSHPIRQKIFQLPIPVDCVIKQRDYWHFRDKLTEKLEYQNVLARSRYSLCPRGAGPNTIRFWESLQAGAIPVLIADDMVLPDWFDWQSCIIHIAEQDFNNGTINIDALIRSIPLDKEEQMRAASLKAYTLFSGDNIVSTIRQYYDHEIE